MKLLDLGVLYLIVGAACALALYRRAPHNDRAALINALTAVGQWPRWAPIAWTARAAPSESTAGGDDVVAGIRSALDEGVESVVGTPLEALLNRDSAKHIVAEVERIAARRNELLVLLARDEFRVDVAECRVETLERQGASPRVRASARLHLGNVRRLRELGGRDTRALEEMAGLVSALRTQLVLVRLSGSSAEGVGDIVSELWARLESLSEASDEAFVTRPLENPA
jgi:hypothetical protein